jgi:hypothetical protein
MFDLSSLFAETLAAQGPVVSFDARELIPSLPLRTVVGILELGFSRSRVLGVPLDQPNQGDDRV